MDIKDKIIVKSDFSDTPGARYKSDGPNSGELLEKLLTENSIMLLMVNTFYLLT